MVEVNSVRTHLVTWSLLILLVGCDSARPARPPIGRKDGGAAEQFVEVTRKAGIRFQHVNGAAGQFRYPETFGSGAAFFDYDRDGWLDLLFVNGCYWPGEAPPNAPSSTPALYHNNRNGTFTDVTSQSGLDMIFYGMGVAVGDYDNDGFEDLYLTGLDRGILLRNEYRDSTDDGRRMTDDRRPTTDDRSHAASSTQHSPESVIRHPSSVQSSTPLFRDVTAESGVGNEGSWGCSSAWLDYDNDGQLDLFVANYVRYRDDSEIVCRVDGRRLYCGPLTYSADACRLYHNEGNGRFRDASREAGIVRRSGKGLGVAVWDIDGDRFPDIIVANDLTPNYLYRNNQNGTFTDIASGAGVDYAAGGIARAGMGIDVADIRNDGKCSIYISNFAKEPNSHFSQRESFAFEDISGRSGLGAPSVPYLGFGLFFFDFDNDGWKDAFVTNGHVQPDISRAEPSQTHSQRPLLFQNRSGTHFEEVGESMGSSVRQTTVGRGAAWGDYDNDGDPDILVTSNARPAMLLRNEGGNRNNWLTVRLKGRKTNRSGIGAEVKVTASGITRRDQVRSGSSYLSASDQRLHFGLGNARSAESIEVRWPSGVVDRLRTVKANRILTIEEGQTGDGGGRR